MKKSMLTTETGDYWHYNPIGTGVIITYHVRAKQVIITCEHTGVIIETKDITLGYFSKEQFHSEARDLYNAMVDDGTTINLDYMDDPTIVGEIGVDFDLLKN